MIHTITDDTPIAMLTVGQLREVIKQGMQIPEVAQQGDSRCLVRGYDGLAKVLDVSRAWVGRLVASGKLDEAITRSGRIIRFDVNKVEEILGRKTGGRNK